jgi:hypothetical protein
MKISANITSKLTLKHPSHLGMKSFIKFIIDRGCWFRTLSLHMVTGLVKNNMSHKHIKCYVRTTKMYHDENTNNLETQVFQTNIQIKWSFMHYHI